ncbi:MAG TPA: hypothetical protein VH000_05335 [Rhizomicrobium sp.]|jgi:hypothetical protein|nr:hypothetical protein [Rhizomicrobium sp.]
MRRFDVGFVGLLLALAPSAAFACACGCAVFDVGTSSLLPSGPGGTVFLEYDFLNQTKNWSGTSSAPAANNDDKNIRSNFYLAGGQYMFNEDWGVMAEVPYTQRHFVTADEDNPGSFDHGSIGDVRLMDVYSGFEPDMSSGIIFGAKLPTGDHTYANFDPDVEISSGSTDLLLGAYKTGALTADQSFTWFGQALWQHEISTQDGYTPGSELNAAAGVSYEGWSLGPNAKVAPVVQAIYSHRGHDGGQIGEPDNTGYDRALVAPGIEVSVNQWKLYADAEFPVYQDVTGNQLIAPVAYKFILSYSF